MIANFLNVISLSRSAFGWFCHGVQTDAICLQVIPISRTSSGRCCPVVRTDADCLHNPCLQRKIGIFLNFEERPDVLT
jgi:hypothetical protein